MNIEITEGEMAALLLMLGRCRDTTEGVVFWRSVNSLYYKFTSAYPHNVFTQMNANRAIYSNLDVLINGTAVLDTSEILGV